MKKFRANKEAEVAKMLNGAEATNEARSIIDLWWEASAIGPAVILAIYFERAARSAETSEPAPKPSSKNES